MVSALLPQRYVLTPDQLSAALGFAGLTVSSRSALPDDATKVSKPPVVMPSDDKLVFNPQFSMI